VRFVFSRPHGKLAQSGGDLVRHPHPLGCSALSHRSFANVRELAAAIYKLGKHWNNVLRRPFEWTYSGRVLQA